MWTKSDSIFSSKIIGQVIFDTANENNITLDTLVIRITDNWFNSIKRYSLVLIFSEPDGYRKKISGRDLAILQEGIVVTVDRANILVVRKLSSLDLNLFTGSDFLSPYHKDTGPP